MNNAPKTANMGRAAASANVTSSTGESWEALTERVERLGHDLSDVTDAAATLVKAGASEGQEKFRETIDEFTRRSGELRRQGIARARQAARKIGEQANSLTRDLEDTIDRHPLASLAVALGVGFIVGLTARRR
jgi:ElaB/YqjD/DUF883 family membrane-anchored ribosome-binding protein